jgi:hypothetical protein
MLIIVQGIFLPYGGRALSKRQACSCAAEAAAHNCVGS